MSAERLQKILARAGVASRRAAEELIAAGRVTVNGAVAGLGDKADPDRDAIKLDGRRIQPARGEHVYLLLNKPRGVMSTRADPEGRPTVLDLVPPRYHKALVPVGRLDFQTEGLLLLTDDGELAQRVSHPRYGCTKVYEVKVKGQPEEKAVDKLRRGIVLDGRRTAPVAIEPRKVTGGARPSAGNSWWAVELSEGRTRQIREMFFRIGHPVQRLRRVAIGPLTDPRLPLGAVRELTAAEVEQLRRSTRGGGGKQKGSPADRSKGSRPGRSKAAPEAASPRPPRSGERRSEGDRARGDRARGARPSRAPRAKASGSPAPGRRGRRPGGGKGR